MEEYTERLGWWDTGMRLLIASLVFINWEMLCQLCIMAGPWGRERSEDISETEKHDRYTVQADDCMSFFRLEAEKFNFTTCNTFLLYNLTHLGVAFLCSVILLAFYDNSRLLGHCNDGFMTKMNYSKQRLVF